MKSCGQLAADKKRFPNALAAGVAAAICSRLEPACERIIVAGSLRRNRPLVGDVEIVYISKWESRPSPDDMFSTTETCLVTEIILALENRHVLERRKNSRGSVMFGPKNKLMRHIPTGLPVDFFATTIENWWNYLVCRTGPAESNIRIAAAAKSKGWQWNPYGAGFSKGEQVEIMNSEADVFSFVGLPFLNPEQR